MVSLAKIFGGIVLVILGFLLYVFSDSIPLQGTLGVIIEIAMIVGGITLATKGAN